MSEYKEATLHLIPVIRGNMMEFPGETSPICKQICFGVLRHYYELVFYRDSLLAKNLPSKHLDIKLLLLCGIYSICHLKRPAHASVNAVVETTVSMNKSWAKGLVNAVMRSFQRQRSRLEKAAKCSPGTRFNHPDWFIKYLKDFWPNNAEEIMNGNNQMAPMTLRVNRQKITVSQYMKKLKDLGIECMGVADLPQAVRLSSPASVKSLPGFHDGWISIQDEASQLVAPLVNAKPGYKVLDVCAAPGGKTCHLLELQPNIDLTAMDKDSYRVEQIHSNLRRLGLGCKVMKSNFLTYAGSSKFDRIILDAPCSATGVIRRHPDIKLLRTKRDIEKLSAVQIDLLRHAWRYLARGGEVIYSTCSVLPHENEYLLRRFINEEKEAFSLPIDIARGLRLKIGHQLFPQINGHDGFYIARIRKGGEE